MQDQQRANDWRAIFRACLHDKRGAGKNGSGVIYQNHTLNYKTMKKFTFNVTQTDVYTKQYTIESESEDSAIEQLESDLEDHDIATDSNSFSSSSKHIGKAKLVSSQK